MYEPELSRTAAAELLGVDVGVPAVRVRMALQQALKAEPERELLLKDAAEVLMRVPRDEAPERAAPTIEPIAGGQRRRLRKGQPGYLKQRQELARTKNWWDDLVAAGWALYYVVGFLVLAIVVILAYR